MEKTRVNDLYCCINLDQTNYEVEVSMATILQPEPDALRQIYNDYCCYKEFASVTPLHDAMILNDDIEVIGYYDGGELVAFSLMRHYDSETIENIQFAWNYDNPELRLGIKSLEAECAYFKTRGFKFIELGLDAPYKKEFDGFEYMGPA
jgi:hypothetical protein|tara:strand:+ start:414 stop:860 length:447 start_codon:yes stop_codon:yes gene_type:complete